MSMREYVEIIECVYIRKHLRRARDDQSTSEEYDECTSLAGSIIWAGPRTLIQAAFVGSFIQPMASSLRVNLLTEVNRMIRELKALNHEIQLKKLKGDITRKETRNYSDAAFNIVAGRDYGQTGMLPGLSVTTKFGNRAFQFIDWSSCKQQRVRHSSYGVEILAR